jgi:CBS domain-containing protein
MRVGELMTSDVKACHPGDSLNRAAQIMWENDCGCVPVEDDAGRVVGMLTDRDACMAAYTQGRALSEIPVESAMSRMVVACRAEETAAAAERLMREQRIRRLAVLDRDGRLAGILSLSDIARRARPSGKKRSDLGVDAIGATLAAICERPHSGEAAAAEAFVAWTGTRAKPSPRRAADTEKGAPAKGTRGARPAKNANKPSRRGKQD